MKIFIMYPIRWTQQAKGITWGDAYVSNCKEWTVLWGDNELPECGRNWERNKGLDKECTTAAAVVRVLGGKFLEVSYRYTMEISKWKKKQDHLSSRKNYIQEGELSRLNSFPEPKRKKGRKRANNFINSPYASICRRCSFPTFPWKALRKIRLTPYSIEKLTKSLSRKEIEMSKKAVSHLTKIIYLNFWNKLFIIKILLMAVVIL